MEKKNHSNAIGAKGNVSIEEFCLLAAAIIERCGSHTILSSPDKNGHVHISTWFEVEGIDGHGLFGRDIVTQHRGYIDIKTGSLIWDERHEQL